MLSTVNTTILVLIEYDVIRWLSSLMYVIFGVGLFNLGAKYQEAVVNKDRTVGQFPEGYFTMLWVQLFPLTISGFLLQDMYLIGTRVGTLLMVLLVYAMSASKDGTFNTKKFHIGVGVTLTISMLGPLLWSEYPGFRTFVHKNENTIVWFSVAVMFLFVIKGQVQVAKALLRHFIEGNYTVKRMNLQVVRFFGFFFQALHYWYKPSKAAPMDIFGYAKFDPIFVQGAMGALGVSWVLLSAAYGFVHGRHARRKLQEEEMLARSLVPAR